MILATPSLARIFDATNNFIPHFIERAYGDAGTGLNIDVVGAVVDQISLPAGAPNPDVSFDHPYMSGMEGLSFLVTTNRAAQFDLWRGQVVRGSPNSTSGLAKQGSWDRSTLSFGLHTNNDVSKRVAGKYVDPLVQYTVQLPLTNTTFRNGKSSTLVGQSWTTKRNSENYIEAEFVRGEDLAHAMIKVQLDDSDTSLEPDFHKWHYLTPPRIVSRSAGNVVSTLKSNMGLAGEIPASEELEAAVSKRIFLRDRDPPDFYEIWAQVTPKERRLDVPTNKNLEGSFQSGDRFLKVLSGGGGWGQKRGLIALDPEASFDGSEPEPEVGDKPFQDLVQPGDVVRFIGTYFRKSRDLKFLRRRPLTKDLRYWSSRINMSGGTSLRFGATVALEEHGSFEEEAPARDVPEESAPSEGPSAKDNSSGNTQIQNNAAHDSYGQQIFEQDGDSEVPGEAKQYSNWTREFQSMAAFGHFGALSEQGISVSVDTYTDSRDKYVGSLRPGNVVKTKLPPLVDLSYCERSFVPFRGAYRYDFYHAPRRHKAKGGKTEIDGSGGARLAPSEAPSSGPRAGDASTSRAAYESSESGVGKRGSEARVSDPRSVPDRGEPEVDNGRRDFAGRTDDENWDEEDWLDELEPEEEPVPPRK